MSKDARARTPGCIHTTVRARLVLVGVVQVGVKGIGPRGVGELPATRETGAAQVRVTLSQPAVDAITD